MHYRIINDLPVYQFNHFKDYHPHLCHFITTRKGGCSKRPYHSLNLGWKTADLPSDVRRNREIIVHRINTSRSFILFPEQVHGNTVRIVSTYPSYKEKTEDFEATDGIVTNLSDLAIGVLMADCVPVLMFDPKNQVIAAIHVGWRGAVNQIIPEAVTAMKHVYGTDPVHVLAGIGPSIGPDAFEIGNDVKQKWEHHLPDLHHVFHLKNGKLYLNLWKAVYEQCIKEGLIKEHIECGHICTYYNEHLFFSHRRTGGVTGRMAAVMMIRP